MFFAYFLIGVLMLILYGLLGFAMLDLMDEFNIFDDVNIDVKKYPLAFMFFWPLMVIAIPVFGVKQMIGFIIDMFHLRKD